MKYETVNVRCIAIDPYGRGIAFVVIDTPQFLLDWGSVEVPKDTDGILREVKELVERYGPNILFVEDPSQTLRGEGFKSLAPQIAALARSEGVAVRFVSLDRRDRNHPDGRLTKRDWVKRVIAIFPQLGNYKLPPRRPWDSERDSMHVIDAASLVVKALDLDGTESPDMAEGP